MSALGLAPGTLVIFEIPKSKTFTENCPLGVRMTNRLAGLMHDAERVRFRQGFAGLQHELNGLLGRQSTALLDPH
jgi:hypothetical protein